MLAVEHPHVLDMDVADEALLASILADRSHGLAMSAWDSLLASFLEGRRE